jgi:hypothetical protein
MFIEFPLAIIYESVEKPLKNSFLSQRQEGKAVLKKTLQSEVIFDIKAKISKEQKFEFGELEFTFSPNLMGFQVVVSGYESWLPESVIVFSIECKSPNWVAPSVRVIKKPDYRLYFYETGSHSWYGNHSQTVPVIPSPTCTCSMVKKKKITQSFHLFPDLLPRTPYQYPVKGEGEFNWSGIRIILKSTFNGEPPNDYTGGPPPLLPKWDRAYHGTVDSAIESIIRDSLVRPGTITTTGYLVNPPKHHIDRYKSVQDIPDFSGAIFLSPSLGYSSCSVYAQQASLLDGKHCKTVLECAVERESYVPLKNTTPAYKTAAFDPALIEWRVTDPLKIRIMAVLLICSIDHY